MNKTDRLTTVLLQLRANKQILAYSQSRAGLRIWAPGRRIDRETRRLVREQSGAILELMRSADIRTCPAADYHRTSWRYAGSGRFTCGLCERLGVA